MANSENKKDDFLSKIRHSTAHIMAEAVLRIFPDAKIAIGPSIENGFYYDFDLPRALKPEDLEGIEEKMRENITEKHDFVKKVVTKSEALKVFKDQPFKIELINDLPEDEEISLYTNGNFTDLCKGPHIENSRHINTRAFKLLSIAGAY